MAGDEFEAAEAAIGGLADEDTAARFVVSKVNAALGRVAVVPPPRPELTQVQ